MRERGLYGPERLRVYQLTLVVAAQVDTLLKRVRLYPSLLDQLLRALDSILLNIAEGAAFTSPARKRYHYQVARASTAECLAIIDRIVQRYAIADVHPIRRNLNMISKMLLQLINTQKTD